VTFFDDRAASAKKKLDELAKSIRQHLQVDETRVLKNDTCIYTVGSGARGEMSEHSDVDLFVARVGRAPSDIDAFQIRQAITRALFELNLPEPSQGGEFLKMHTGESLCERMCTPDDDATNTLTARMLLLLESQALLGNDAYDTLVASVIDAYWKDASDHMGDYQPFVLVNDIVRYWRILLLNYVAKNAKKERELGPPKLKAERSLRGYKLRFSRCMTCFSALARLLVAAAKGGVKKEDVCAIVGERPIERLLAVQARVSAASMHVNKMLALYETFLKTTACAKSVLIDSFCQDEFAHACAREGRDFADAMFALLQELGSTGRGRELFRHMVV
jgi:predicted nucleotidyltransferase